MEPGFDELHCSYKDAVDNGECSGVDVLGGHNVNQKVGSLSLQNPAQGGGKGFPVCAGNIKSSAITTLGF